MLDEIVIELTTAEAHELLDFLLESNLQTTEGVDKIVEMLQYRLEELTELESEYED